MATRIFIDGAAGTTGLEIRDRLEGREEFELLVLDDAQRKDVSARKEALHEADITILCLPDEAAREAVKLAEGSDTRIIDASSAHRVADGWTYGFPEIIGHDRIANAQFVSNPGCYPTGFIALVRPLIDAGLLSSDSVWSINAVSGYSGGGKSLIERFESDKSLGWRGYAYSTDHKHLPEMEMYGCLESAPIFAPAVVPVYRGMIVEVPKVLNRVGYEAKPGIYRHALAKHFESSPVVNVVPQNDNPTEMTLEAGAAPWDGMDLYVFGSPNGWDMRLVARLDNLGKGASGAAIQNLNIMCGLPETTGLRL